MNYKENIRAARRGLRRTAEIWIVSDHKKVLVRGVTVGRLLDTIDPQTGPVSILEAIYQVVGHFHQHTGQIIFTIKVYASEDLGLYRPQPTP